MLPSTTITDDVPSIKAIETPTIAPPLFIDLGKQKPKDTRKLRNGKGSLMEDINDTLRELMAAGQISANAQPVIILVRDRPKRKGSKLSFF